MGWSKLTDMSLSDDDILDMVTPIAFGDDDEKPTYPCQLRICFTDAELEKLGLDDSCDIGDMIDMRCFGEVTSVSKGAHGCRIEIQITHMACENEMNEDEDDDD